MKDKEIILKVLELLYSEIKDLNSLKELRDGTERGLCDIIFMYLLPQRFIEYYDGKITNDYIHDETGTPFLEYAWPMDEVKPRKKWLKKHISKLKKEILLNTFQMIYSKIKDLNSLSGLNKLSLSGNGLCDIIDTMYIKGYITLTADIIIRQYIYNHKPKNTYNNEYFWRPGVVKPRKKYLKKHILKLKILCLFY